MKLEINDKVVIHSTDSLIDGYSGKVTGFSIFSSEKDDVIVYLDTPYLGNLSIAIPAKNLVKLVNQQPKMNYR